MAKTVNKIIVTPDARKSLDTLSTEWDQCTKCSLGEQREASRGFVVHGEGIEKTQGILFIGDFPGLVEERHGAPFDDKEGGRLMRKCLTRYRIKNAYITYMMGCRSCDVVKNDDGTPRLYKSFNGGAPHLLYRNQPPSKGQITACAPRIYEMIYILDPVVIVAMGPNVSSFLADTKINLKQSNATPMEIEVPGAGHIPILSTKRKEWSRKVKGTVVVPMEQSKVRYLLIPTYNVSLAYERRHDTLDRNVYQEFHKAVHLAKVIYDRYHEEISGLLPESYELSIPNDILEEMEMEDDNNG